MRVGVDARCLSRELTGIGYYTINIVNELDKCGIETVLFSPSPLQIDVQHLRHCTIVCKMFKNLFVRQIWSELYLPYILKHFNLDVFWGPSHRMPLVLPKRVAAVITIHDLVWKKSPKTMRRSTLFLESTFMPQGLRKANVIISDTQSTAADLLEFFPDTANKICHIPLAPRFNKKKTNQLKNKTDEMRYILFVGTIEPRKNIESLIVAYSLLSTNIQKKFTLILVGGKGWGDVDIEKHVLSSGVKNNILMKAYVSNSELFELYKNAYCLAMPSLYEGFGLPILEAQMFGVPAITSNVSSMPEVVGDGGVLVDPYSIDSIREGLDRVLSDKILRKKLSIKAKKNVAQYSWDRTTQLTIDAFNEAIEIKAKQINGR